MRQGKPFEQVASDKGLTLDAVTFTEIEKSDILDPSVAEAAFSEDLQEGDITEPVNSLFGWTVVQLAGRVPAENRTFEDVREELKAEYLEQDTRKRVFEAIDQLEDARDTGASLAAAAEQAGVESIRFGPVDKFSFAPGGAIIADIAGEVLAEVFDTDEGEQSEYKELASGGYFYVEVEEVTPPAPMPYDEVADEVETRWRADERRERIAAAVKQVTDAIAAGQTFAEAAEPFNRAVLETTLDRRHQQTSFSPSFTEKIFSADVNDVVASEAGASGAQTIAEIRGVEFARSRIGPGEETAFRQYLSYQLNQEYLEAYIEALRNDYGVKANQNALDAIFNDGA